MSEEVQDEASNKSASLSESPLGAECVHIDAYTNVSQTHVGQMTASAVPPAADVPGKWNCEVCTYENFPMSKKCTMCRSSKPLLGEDIFRLQDGASALPPSPTQDICGAEVVAERLKPLRISSPQSQASASCVAKWPCPTCTYENWPKSVKCAMCGHGNPAPAASPPPDSKRPTVGINELCPPPSLERLDERRRRNIDWLWLQACLGVVEGDPSLVAAYLGAGGDPARSLTQPEVKLLDRASAFDIGHTLVHLAIRANTGRSRS